MHFQRLYSHTASTTESCVGQINSLEGVWFRSLSLTPSGPLGRLRTPRSALGLRTVLLLDEVTDTTLTFIAFSSVSRGALTNQ